jgi:hypothetical protein
MARASAPILSVPGCTQVWCDRLVWKRRDPVRTVTGMRENGQRRVFGLGHLAPIAVFLGGNAVIRTPMFIQVHL